MVDLLWVAVNREERSWHPLEASKGRTLQILKPTGELVEVQIGGSWSKVIYGGFSFKAWVNPSEWLEQCTQDPAAFVTSYLNERKLLQSEFPVKFETFHATTAPLLIAAERGIDAADAKSKLLKTWKSAARALASGEMVVVAKSQRGNESVYFLSFIGEGTVAPRPHFEIVPSHTGETSAPTVEIDEKAPTRSAEQSIRTDVLTFLSSLAAGTPITKATATRLQQKPLELAQLANGIYRTKFQEFAKQTDPKVDESCRETLGMLAFLCVPPSLTRSKTDADLLSSKQRSAILGGLKIDASQILKRAFREVGPIEAPALAPQLLARLSETLDENTDVLQALEEPEQFWLQIMKLLEVLSAKESSSVWKIARTKFIGVIRPSTSLDDAVFVMNSMASLDILDLAEKSTLYVWLKGRGSDAMQLRAAWAATTLSSILSKSKTPFLQSISDLELSEIVAAMCDEFDGHQVAESDFGFYVNAATRVSMLIPENIVKTFFDVAASSLPVLTKLADDLKRTGSAQSAQNANAVLLESTKAKDEALSTLLRQLASSTAEVEKLTREVDVLRQDFNRQVESSKGSYIQTLGTALANASAELEDQFGLVDVNVTLQRLLTHMRGLSITRDPRAGTEVTFDKNIHSSLSSHVSDGDLVRVLKSGYIQKNGNEIRVLIRAEVE